MKRLQTKLHVDVMSHSKVIRSEKAKLIIRSKFIVRSNFSCSTVCSSHRYFS